MAAPPPLTGIKVLEFAGLAPGKVYTFNSEHHLY